MFHTAIIGAGSGGITVAVGLAGFGKNVALIERNHIGGDCTNVGCVPSKVLIHLASHIKEQTLSAPEILAKVRERRDHLRDEETEWMENTKNVKLYKAAASFVDANTLELSYPEGKKERIKAKNIVIATGSAPIKIPIEGLPEHKALSNESLFDLNNLPSHMAILGAGVIGCEMAFAFRKLGSEVSLIDLAPRILSVLEPEVSALMHKKLEDAGVKVYIGAKAKGYEDATQTLCLDHQGADLAVNKVDKVLLAIGRKPNLDLKLENAGVKMIRQGIPSNHFGQTSQSNIYAIGDVNLNSAFTHSANAQGRRLVQKLALPFVPLGKEPIYPSATFSEPEIAQVGPNLEALHKQFHPELIRTYRIDLKDTDRGYTQYLEDGFLLIHAMRLSGRVLSASIVAPNASEMISPLTLAINEKISMYKLANLVFPYPTMSEAIKKAASNYVFGTLPKLLEELKAYLQYRWSKPN